MSQIKAAFNIIATNKYLEFADEHITSMEKHVKIPFKVNVFTNRDYEREGVSVVKVEHQPWPMMTLLRFHLMQTDLDVYEGCSHIFYTDADMLFVSDAGEEIISERTATLHPGFFNKPRHLWTYEFNPYSTACMGKGQGDHYYCGGFYGAEKEEFLRMCGALTQRINTDLQNGLMAVWHDESHFNRWMWENKPTRVLPPSYCYPESWDLSFEKILLALDKNHEEIRNG